MDTASLDRALRVSSIPNHKLTKHQTVSGRSEGRWQVRHRACQKLCERRSELWEV